MTSLKWKLLFLSTNFLLLQGTWGSFVEFYAKRYYKELHQEFTFNKTNEDQCIEVKDLGIGKDKIEVRSLKTDRCLMLYGLPGCTYSKRIFDPRKDTNDRREYYYGKVSFRVDQNEPLLTSFGIDGKYVSSFHVCSQSRGGGPEVDVDFYENVDYDGKKLAEFKNVCGCKNIPMTTKIGKTQVVSVDNHGNGIELFENENCQGESTTLEAGHTFTSRGLFTEPVYDRRRQKFVKRFDIRSIRPVDFLNCIKLDATIHKFRFRNGTQIGNDLTTENVKLAADTVIRSNGKVKLMQDYSITSKVSETLDFTTASALSNMHTFGVDLGYEAEVEAGVPFVSKGKSKWKAALSYKYQRTSTDTKTNRSSVVNEETLVIGQKIEVSPCQECKVSSFVRKMKNFPIEYEAFAKVRGTAAGKVMSAQEIKTYLLPGMEYAGDYDENTVDTVVKGVMHAEFGISAFINADCEEIPGCKATYMQSSELVGEGKKHSYAFEVPLTYIMEDEN